jgi:hypothetical protein
VAERPDEQLAPNSPTFNALALYMAARSRIDAVRTNGQAPSGHPGQAAAFALGEIIAGLMAEPNKLV